MKKNMKKADTRKTRTPQFGRVTLLVGALVAAGVLSTLSLPEAIAAPLPVPCGGCVNAAGVAIPNFVQAGNFSNFDPITGLPVANGHNLTIHQDSQTAILNWQSFDIAHGYSVNFEQPNSTSSTLNRIWSADPSHIAGSLTANGQLYLINQNGIVFANGAQVNTDTLIASSLDIDSALYKAGYLTNAANKAMLPAFGDGINGVHGFVKVETGAVLNGSRVMLFAPVVENNGSISTPDGQTVLAAGTKIYLEASQDPNLRGVLVEVDVANPGAADSNLVGKVQNNAAGTATNAGDIISERGNITLIGFAVNQQGRVSATTSVTENGSIKLLARYHVETNSDIANHHLADDYLYDIRATQTGKVTLAKDSVTQVVPELTDASTTTDGQGFNPSIVEVMGNTIEMQSGSSIVAPGGNVTLAAMGSISSTPGGENVYQEILSSNTGSSFLNPNYKPASTADSARVFLDTGSSIDVSGSSASVSVARNILAVQLRGSQLADAPLQHNGYLWGQNVLIDMRYGSTLANYSGEEAQVGRTVAERTSIGGTVKLVSTGDVVMKAGSKVDISGGQINYTGANIKATTLISDGVAYDIATASPDRIYNGISGTYTVNHAKWGVTETFNTMAGGDARGRWDPGYVEGKAAGTLIVLAPHAVVDSDIVAHTVAGTFQRNAFVDYGTATVPYKDTWQMMAKGGTLVIGDNAAVTDATTGITNYINVSNVTIQSTGTHLASDFTLFDQTGNVNALSTNFQQNITLDANLFNADTGLNRLEVYSNKSVKIAGGTVVKLVAGGSITLKGDTVNVQGSIDVPAGTVKLATAQTTASSGNTATAPCESAGALCVGLTDSGAYISTGGQWVNDALQTGVPDLSKPLLINGGSINLSSGGYLKVAAGASLDASGGAWLDASNKLHGGNGGAITLASSSGNLQMAGLKMRSYGTAGGKGGALTIKAGNIYLGTASNIDPLANLILSPEFFQSGGFGSYNLTAQGPDGLTVFAGAVIEPKAQSLILDRTAATQASGSDVNAFAGVGLLPDWQRPPVRLTLTQSSKNSGALTVEAGAVIRVEPTASIALTASNQMTVLGTLDAPAGSITLGLTTNTATYNPTQSIWLGSQSELLSQGYFQKAQPNAQNLAQGQVLKGGKINIATNSFVVAQKGSLMDVSGTSANIDLPQLASGALVYRNSHVAGDGGSITVQTSGGGYLDGNMNAGIEAGSSAAAGAFSLTLNNNPGINDSTNLIYPKNPAQIQLMSGGNGTFAIQAGLTPGDDSGAGNTPLDQGVGNGIAGQFFLDAKALQKSGFDQVTLKSDTRIVLADQVNLQTRRSITLDAPELVSNGTSKMTSAHVTLGNLGSANQAVLTLGTPNPTPSGELDVYGQLVDLTGNFVVSGVNQVNIVASNENSSNAISSNDIRLNGVINYANSALTGNLNTQGNITLTADQVYPTTMAEFKLSVVDDAGKLAGKIKVNPGSHGASPVMSAGGKLELDAAVIEQDGVLKAPMGTITLNGTQRVTLGEGSLTSVSADDLTMLFGQIQGGKTWVYDLVGAGTASQQVTISQAPQKLVTLSAPTIDVRTGAKVNLSGGGDLYANEFFAGGGGTVNVLDPSKAPANTFAIIPGLSGFAPYDPQAAGQYAQSTSKTTLQTGASVYLEGGNGLAAGYYTLLPASYALLPGAYRVTAVTGYADRQPGQGVTTQLDGTQIMAGKFAVVGTDIQDARYSGFAVTPGAVVRKQAEYHDSFTNQFFTAQATTDGTVVSRLPQDAGQLIISAVGTGADLKLDGTFIATPGTGGRGAMVDFNGPGFDIVDTKGPANGLVQLTASSLNNLGVESLLIGGVRTQGTTGEITVTVGADKVVVGAVDANGVSVAGSAGSVLVGPEIILAANTAVTVKNGSGVEGKGTFSGQANNITIANVNSDKTPAYGDGALLRVSSAEQVTVTRTNPAAVPVAANLTVEDGATVGAENNAILLDSSNVTTVGNNAILKGKSLSVAAYSIDVGTNPNAAANSLALSGNLLTQVQAFKDLTLHSYSDINFYGTGSLGVDGSNKRILNNLVLNSFRLNGIDNAGSTNVIDAANVTLMNGNTGTSPSDAPAYGGGNLTINADQITLGAGDKTIQGFNTVTMVAAKQIVGQGTGSIMVTGGDSSANDKLVLQAGQITGTNKSNQTITAATKAIEISSVAGATVAAGEALNAKLAIVGKSIVDKGIINLAGGSVTLQAKGADATDGVTLGNGAAIIANGVSKTISGQTVYAQAGTVSLTSDNGGVDIKSGSVVDVSGASDAHGGSDAGSINIAATNGAATVAGSLKGSADANHAKGSFTLDAKSLTGSTANALTDLNDTLSAGTFTTLRDMRIRTGDLVIAADAPGTVRAKAQTFRLTADTGAIDVFGTIDSSGTNGGNILLAANNNLTLHPGALLDAHSTGAGQTGGKVTLETTVGTIDLGNQFIDVHSDGNTGGNVLLRAPQINTNTDVAVNNTGGSSLHVSSGASVTVEAFRQYTATNLATSNVGTSSAYFTDAQAFANNYAASIKNRLGMTTDQHLTPGVELDSTGDMKLAADWDLHLWRFNDGNGNQTEPGILTLRAGGNLILSSSLSDGFAAGGGDTTVAANFTPISGPSWSYRLVAGADTSSANVMSVRNAGGNVQLAEGTEAKPSDFSKTGRITAKMKQVRTGTGFIDVAAGGDIVLGNRDSVIYTAGQQATSQQTPGLLANTSTDFFPTGGGDISLFALGDINATDGSATGTKVNQLITEWQFRQGVAGSVYSATTQPAWWINYSSFRQNIGALGGGNVTVSAGGNINNLSVVAPTSGYVATPGAAPILLGSGNLKVSAAKDINSGVFYVGKGQGVIRAGGALGSTRSVATVLALGTGNFDVRTGGDLNLQTVLNPTAVIQGYAQIAKNNGNTSFFYTYGDSSGVSLTSQAGNVKLVNDAAKIAGEYNFGQNSALAGLNQAIVYPGSLQVTALDGSITANKLNTLSMTLFPSASGNLKFVAATDINLPGLITMSSSDPAMLQVNSPVLRGNQFQLPIVNTSNTSSIHVADSNPVIIVAGGSIIGDNFTNSPNLVLPKAAIIQAGQDIQNLSLNVQNLNSTDTTSVVAGRDILFTQLESNKSATTLGIAVEGPGQVVLQAGRNVNLGQSDGITTTGNLTNSLLPEQGASVTVLAGVGQGATDTKAFIDKYIDPATAANHNADLIAYVGKYEKNPPTDQTAAQAFATFGTLSQPLQDAFVRQVFFSELKQTGRSAVSTGNYQKGYDAIATLFPSTGYKGDINLYYSQIKTQRGGDINLLTPGGGVNAGLANASSSGPVKTPAELGIVTIKGGDVNAFVNNDFMVNQSRVFTLQGGNILMWSSYGNIDAGKGSKTASSTPAPVLRVDPTTGTFNVDATGSIVGSGIRVLLANKNVVPGDVDLIAPAGTVNAGDAGIGSAGNITIAALHVVGADNINFGGVAAGVPVAAPAPVSVGLGNLSDSNAANQMTQSIANMGDMGAKDFKPTFLSIEVIGLGDGGGL